LEKGRTTVLNDTDVLMVAKKILREGYGYL